jgi:predicted helicase
LWLTAGMSEEFDLFLPLGSKEETTETIFRLFSNGVKTNRDAWAWNFNRDVLAANMKKTIETYNDHVLRWPHRSPQTLKADDFVTYDPTKISWSESLKNRMTRSILIEFHDDAVRAGVYRPFTTQYVYFEEALAERRYRLPSVFPTAPTENRVIWLKVGSAVPMFLLMVNRIPEVLPAGGSQCFPFYTYAEDGTGRRENITGWALEQFRRRYQSEVENRKSKITKWDIFHYVYAVLHHPEYRARYAANLRRELPRIPFVRADIATPSEPSGGTTSASSDSDVFWEFVKAGKRLAELHTGFEQAKEYPLERRENPDAQLNWRVEKMRLSKDKSAIVYNGFLTLAGIPKETFDYRLGNRSALEWVIDQYQVSTDKRSGITNDPNRPDDPQYIVRLVGQIITVSLETMKVLKSLPALED